MKNYILSASAVVFLLWGCNSDAEGNVTTTEEQSWTIEHIDEVIKYAETLSKNVDCKIVNWVIKDEGALPLDLVGTVDTPEFTHEGEYCDLGDGMVKYIFNEAYHEFYAVNEFFVRNGKLMFVTQDLNSEGYLMNRKFYYNQKGELLKGVNTDFLEDDKVTVRSDLHGNYDELIKENSEEALEQFKMIQTKFK